MLTLRMPEENVLNGGAFGFEGSLICTVLMIVFYDSDCVVGRKKRSNQSCCTSIILS